MRYIIFLLAMVITTRASSQTIPDTVKHAFAKKFQNVSKEKWTVEEKQYKVSFVKEKKQMAATFTKNGVLTETRTALIANDLPYNVTNYIEAKLDGAQIKNAALLTKGKKKIYEVEISNRKLFFTEDGQYLRGEKL